MNRTRAQLREHYEIERELADRLRAASKGERGPLYAACYDELFRRVPHHPQLVRKADLDAQREGVKTRGRLVRHYLPPRGTFVEVGPGDCSLAIAMCESASRVFAVDVSAEITGRLATPANFELILSDGATIPLPLETADLVFSYQLIEHLHPEDAQDHLHEVYRVLKPGGKYLCVTPNRLSGPHDVSRHFDRVATGFHIKEYTNGDLVDVFSTAGFSSVEVLFGVRGRFYRTPRRLIAAIERALDRLPYVIRRPVAGAPLVGRLLGATVLGTK